MAKAAEAHGKVTQVIGAVVDVAEGAIAVVGVAIANVVVVGPDDDHLLRQLRIAPLDEREDVAHAAEWLVIRASVARRRDTEFCELLDDVGGRGTAPPAAPFSTLE